MNNFNIVCYLNKRFIESRNFVVRSYDGRKLNGLGFRLLWSSWIGTECVEIGKFSAGLFGLWGLAASGLHHRTEVTYFGGNGYDCLQVSGKKTINFCTKN